MKAKIVLLCAGVFLGTCALLSCRGVALEERIELKIADQSFRIEVARSEEQKRRGLMHRQALGPREGMIFVYGTDQHLAFWMKDTTLPLTLAFLSKDGEILQIESLKPLSLKSVVSHRAARFGLELSAGVLDELGVRVGDRVEFPKDFP